MSIAAVFAVFCGAGLGALLRWGLGVRLNGVFPTVPIGTLAANLLGGLLVGLAIAWLGRNPGVPPELRLFLVTGFLGGLTTFSTFSAEVVTLLARGELGWGFAAVAMHLGGSLALAVTGMFLARVVLAGLAMVRA
jgi:CrcB protein